MPEEPTPPPVQEVSAYPRPTELVPPPTKMEDIADRVGFVPNLRLSDNLIQFVSIVIGVTIGALTCFLIKWPVNDPAYISGLIGALIGLLVATFASGFYLMIKNRRRGR